MRVSMITFFVLISLLAPAGLLAEKEPSSQDLCPGPQCPDRITPDRWPGAEPDGEDEPAKKEKPRKPAEGEAPPSHTTARSNS